MMCIYIYISHIAKIKVPLMSFSSPYRIETVHLKVAETFTQHIKSPQLELADWF